MNRSLTVLRRALGVHQISRSGSTASVSARWSNIVRSESNIDTPEDPPTKPLPEQHEVGEGVSDFSNWVEKHEDVSSAQAFGGLAFILACMYGIYSYSTSQAAKRTPRFTLREAPALENSIPTYRTTRESMEE